MRAVRMTLILVVALLIACPVLAQEKEKKKGRRGGGQPGGAAMVNRLLEGVSLTDEQKTKIADVNKDFDAKVAEARKKLDDILTPEQKKARADAEKAAKDAGKSDREVRTAAREAVKLTDEQQPKFREAMREVGGLERQRVEKVMEALTPEQKEQVQKKIDELKKGGKKKRD
jgi:Spy/CpxP family protein refolding chaperone